MSTSPESLDNAEDTDVAAAARKIYRLLNDAVEQIGGIGVAAGLLGMRRGDLRQALDREERRVGVEQAIAIGRRLTRYNPTLATELGFALVQAMGFGVFPLVTLTKEEENARLRELVRRLPKGEELLAETLGVRR